MTTEEEGTSSRGRRCGLGETQSKPKNETFNRVGCVMRV